MKITFLIWINLCFIVLTILLSSSALAVSFNEIMYNPSGNDNNAEFIEILSNTLVDFSQVMVGDLTKNDSLLMLSGNNESNYTLIVEEGFNYTGLNCSIYTTGKNIGDSLGNSGDALFIYHNNGTLLDSVIYNNTMANGNGKSLELFNDSWQESYFEGGTPCKENSQSPHNSTEDAISNESQQNSSQLRTPFNTTITFIIPDILYTGFNYTPLFKITNEHYKQNAGLEKEVLNITLQITIYGQEFYQQLFIPLSLKYSKRTGLGSFLPDKAGSYTICGYIYNNDITTSVINDNTQDNSTVHYSTICQEFKVLDISKISCDASIMSFTDAIKYAPGQKVSILNKVVFQDNNSFPYTIDYWLEDAYEKVIKKRTTTTNTEKKSWTVPSKNQLQIYRLKSSLHTLCNNSNSLTTAESLFYVAPEQLEESLLYIDDIEIPEAGFELGKLVKAHIHLYKGNTSRSSVHFYLASEQGKEASEIIKLQFFDKYKDVDFDITLTLNDDCELSDSNYFFVAEGFGLKIRKSFPVKKKDHCVEPQKEYEKNDDVRIKSFYTRTKNIGKQLKIFTTLRGNGTADLVLYHHNDKLQQHIDLSQEHSFSFLVNTSEGNNLFLLQLLKDNKTVDLRELSIYREFKISLAKQKIPLQGYIQNKKYLDFLKKQIKNQNNNEHLQGHATETTNAVYISKSTSSKKIIPYLIFVFIILMIPTIFILYRAIWHSKTI